MITFDAEPVIPAAQRPRIRLDARGQSFDVSVGGPIDGPSDLRIQENGPIPLVDSAADVSLTFLDNARYDLIGADVIGQLNFQANQVIDAWPNAPDGFVERVIFVRKAGVVYKLGNVLPGFNGIMWFDF